MEPDDGHRRAPIAVERAVGGAVARPREVQCIDGATAFGGLPDRREDRPESRALVEVHLARATQVPAQHREQDRQTQQERRRDERRHDEAGDHR